VPTPLVAIVSSSVWPRAKASTSSTVLKGLAAGTTMPKVTPLTWMIGVVSRIGSQSSFCSSGARNTGCGIWAIV